jgi:hypothetical protein
VTFDCNTSSYEAMTIDTRFATKLDDAPESLRNVLLDNLPSPDSVRLLIHAPAFLTLDERSPTAARSNSERRNACDSAGRDQRRLTRGFRN